MNDYLIRGMTGNKQVRFSAVNCTEAAQEVQRIHKLSITTSVLMGRLQAAALLMANDLKSESGSLTLKIKSTGKVKNVILTAGKAGNVKAYIDNPQVEIPISEEGRINAAALLEDGVLTVIKELPEGQPYMGNVKLQSGEIASDLAYYFMQSEQIPTALGLGVLIEPQGYIRQAGGFMIQLLPEAEEEVISVLESNLNKFPNLTDVMDMGFDLEKIVNEMLLKNLTPKILHQQPVKYKCDCSAEKFKAGISLLSAEEMQEYLDNEEDIVVQCHFCNTSYRYGKEIIEKYLKNAHVSS